MGLGLYPAVSLKEARRQASKHRGALHEVDPLAEREARKTERQAAARDAENTFEKVAERWLVHHQAADITKRKAQWLLGHLTPHIGGVALKDITPRMLLDALRTVEKTGKLETASRTKTVAGQVFRYAIREQLVDTDPTLSLRGALKSPETRHRAAITEPKQLGGLLRAIDGYAGQPVVRLALKMASLTFVRSAELRGARFEEFDLDAGLWRIPARRMKKKDRGDHLVPLSTQAVAIVRDLRAMNPNGELLFPSIRDSKRTISANTLNVALRVCGYSKDDMTTQGFRRTATTRLNELGWNADAIERQLAHVEGNVVRAAYNAAKYLDERRSMMQAWSDYLDALRDGRSNVIAIGSRKAS